MRNDIFPVFVFGAARTGTTWLGNILRNECNAFTPSHYIHYGVKEVNLYYYQKYWTTFDDKETFFKEFSKTDVYQLLLVKDEVLDINNYTTFYEYFFDLIDIKTRSEQKDKWTIKLCPEFLYFPEEYTTLLDLINKRYEQKQIILIKRNFDEYLHSYINMSGEQKQKRSKNLKLAVALGASRYKVFYTNAEKVLGNYLFLNYEGLLRNKTSIVNRIKDRIGVEKEKVVTETTVVENASIKRLHIRKKLLTNSIAKLFHSSYFLSKMLLDRYERIKKQKPPMYTRVLLCENDPEALIKELEASGDEKLVSLVRDQVK